MLFFIISICDGHAHRLRPHRQQRHRPSNVDDILQHRQQLIVSVYPRVLHLVVEGAQQSLVSLPVARIRLRGSSRRRRRRGRRRGAVDEGGRGRCIRGGGGRCDAGTTRRGLPPFLPLLLALAVGRGRGPRRAEAGRYPPRRRIFCPRRA